MIGIICREGERAIVREFFEFLKTPWEFYRPDRRYNVVICTESEIPEIRAELLMVWGSRENRLDSELKTNAQTKSGKSTLHHRGREIPVYGEILTFSSDSPPLLEAGKNGAPAGIEVHRGDKKILRVGVDLFKEIQFLLTQGQPVEYAHIPTMEIYRSMIKEWILGAGMKVFEVLPVPQGYDFICCLTHDVDFAGIRCHFLDRTMAGFIYRGLVGSLIEVLKGRAPGSKVLKNWGAVCRLPAVYLGLAEDFWVEFDRFLEMEKGLGGTYYFLPFKNHEGQNKSRRAPRIRACKYELEGLRREIEKLIGQGCEVGLHGIDAWTDPDRGREEFQRVGQISGQPEIGVRMHWLYFDAESPGILDQLGFCYDSTVGYNEAIGYRAGTTQVYRPPGVRSLMELPLHIQDTALFYPDRMNLSPRDALQKVQGLIENAETYGGVLTINWHHRSLSPERLWDGFYAQLLGLLKGKKVWFATARQAVEWFRKRRAVSLEEMEGLKSSARLGIDGTLYPYGNESPTLTFGPQGDGFSGKSGCSREKAGILGVTG